MSTNDPAVINQNFEKSAALVEHWRTFARSEGVDYNALLKKNVQFQAFEDAREFWREKKAHLETGGMVDVQAGGRWASFLHDRIDKFQKRIVGTWHWWNGYTVTFNANGGASYRGSSLAQSGVGRWQNTGGNNYHVHWLSSNTNDYFTLSSDNTKLEGKYDGKPGVSTRVC